MGRWVMICVLSWIVCVHSIHIIIKDKANAIKPKKDIRIHLQSDGNINLSEVQRALQLQRYEQLLSPTNRAGHPTMHQSRRQHRGFHRRMGRHKQAPSRRGNTMYKPYRQNTDRVFRTSGDNIGRNPPPYHIGHDNRRMNLSRRPYRNRHHSTARRNGGSDALPRYDHKPERFETGRNRDTVYTLDLHNNLHSDNRPGHESTRQRSSIRGYSHRQETIRPRVDRYRDNSSVRSNHLHDARSSMSNQIVDRTQITDYQEQNRLSNDPIVTEQWPSPMHQSNSQIYEQNSLYPTQPVIRHNPLDIPRREFVRVVPPTQDHNPESRTRPLKTEPYLNKNEIQSAEMNLAINPINTIRSILNPKYSVSEASPMPNKQTQEKVYRKSPRMAELNLAEDPINKMRSLPNPKYNVAVASPTPIKLAPEKVYHTSPLMAELNLAMDPINTIRSISNPKYNVAVASPTPIKQAQEKVYRKPVPTARPNLAIDPIDTIRSIPKPKQSVPEVPSRQIIETEEKVYRKAPPTTGSSLAIDPIDAVRSIPKPKHSVRVAPSRPIIEAVEKVYDKPLPTPEPRVIVIMKQTQKPTKQTQKPDTLVSSPGSGVKSLLEMLVPLLRNIIIRPKRPESLPTIPTVIREKPVKILSPSTTTMTTPSTITTTSSTTTITTTTTTTTRTTTTTTATRRVLPEVKTVLSQPDILPAARLNRPANDPAVTKNSLTSEEIAITQKLKTEMPVSNLPVKAQAKLKNSILSEIKQNILKPTDVKLDMSMLSRPSTLPPYFGEEMEEMPAFTRGLHYSTSLYGLSKTDGTKQIPPKSRGNITSFPDFVRYLRLMGGEEGIPESIRTGRGMLQLYARHIASTSRGNNAVLDRRMMGEELPEGGFNNMNMYPMGSSPTNMYTNTRNIRYIQMDEGLVQVPILHQPTTKPTMASSSVSIVKNTANDMYKSVKTISDVKADIRSDPKSAVESLRSTDTVRHNNPVEKHLRKLPTSDIIRLLIRELGKMVR